MGGNTPLLLTTLAREHLGENMSLWQRIKSWFCKTKPLPSPTVPSTPRPPVTTPSFPSDDFTPSKHRALYQSRWDKMEEKAIGSQSLSSIGWYVSKCIEGKSKYLKVEELTGVPWQVTAAIHGMEASFNFDRQILNGESWRKRTKLVPAGLGPFSSWLEAAVKAYNIKKVPKVWDIPNTLYFCERFNGLGYLNKGRPSPYIWGYSNQQVAGKYVRDGVYDSSAITKQVGVAVQLKRLGFKGA